MLVHDVMQGSVVTVERRTGVWEALRLLQGRGIRHLPVVEDGAVVGIISDRDVKAAMLSAASNVSETALSALLDRLTAEDIMTRAVTSIAPMFPVEEAARIMVREKISALPVTEDGRLVGILTETDVLQLFARAMGALEPSSRLDVILGERPGALAEVVSAVEREAVPISSVVTLVSPGGMKEAVIRLATINPGPAVRALQARGYTVRDSREA